MEQIDPLSVEDSTCPKSQLKEIKTLTSFDTCKTSRQKPPKKEYVRCKLIRGHKRAIRQILSGHLPKATIHKFRAGDGKANSLWTYMREIIEGEETEFKNLAKTEAGPATDGKAKRSKKSFHASHRSFNHSFCKAYFEKSSTRESFGLYLDLIFSNFDSETLCKKFQFRCCRCENHSIDCLGKWADLLSYLKHGMLQELGYAPADLLNFYVNLPSFTNYIESDPEI